MSDKLFPKDDIYTREEAKQVIALVMEEIFDIYREQFGDAKISGLELREMISNW